MSINRKIEKLQNEMYELECKIELAHGRVDSFVPHWIWERMDEIEMELHELDLTR